MSQMALAAVPLAVRAPESPAARSESWRGKTNSPRQRDLGLAGAVWRMGNVWVSYTKLSRPYATSAGLQQQVTKTKALPIKTGLQVWSGRDTEKKACRWAGRLHPSQFIRCRGITDAVSRYTVIPPALTHLLTLRVEAISFAGFRAAVIEVT